ncbi:hypothetical protein N9W44_01170 [Alphaproteobacteria bacterium]|nr:hypothetical protein [Alphaproteobacteria bacterium]
MMAQPGITGALLLILIFPASPIAASITVTDVQAPGIEADSRRSNPWVESPMVGYSEAWFVLWLQELSYTHQPEMAMQIGSLGLKSYPESARIRIAVATAAYQAGRCNWVRDDLVDMRTNLASAKFRQMARDLIYRCFGGWQQYLSIGGLTGRRRSMSGQGDATVIASEEGSRFHNLCSALRGLCDENKSMKLAQARQFAIDMWFDLRAIMHRSTGGGYYTNLSVQTFRRVPSRGKFQASGAGITYQIARPVARRTVGIFQLGTGNSKIRQGAGTTDTDQRHIHGMFGLYFSLFNKRTIVWEVGESQLASADTIFRQTSINTAYRQELAHDWHGELGIKRSINRRVGATVMPSSFSNSVSATLTFPLIAHAFCQSCYRIDGKIQFLLRTEQFSRALFYLARPHQEKSRNISLTVNFLPIRANYPKVEILASKRRLSTINPVKSKGGNSITIRFIFLKKMN